MANHWHHPLVHCWSVMDGGNIPTSPENTPDAFTSDSTHQLAADAITRRGCKSALPCRTTKNGGATKLNFTARFQMERGSRSTTTECSQTSKRVWQLFLVCSKRGSLLPRTTRISNRRERKVNNQKFPLPRPPCSAFGARHNQNNQ